MNDAKILDVLADQNRRLIETLERLVAFIEQSPPVVVDHNGARPSSRDEETRLLCELWNAHELLSGIKRGAVALDRPPRAQANSGKPKFGPPSARVDNPRDCLLCRGVLPAGEYCRGCGRVNEAEIEC